MPRFRLGAATLACAVGFGAACQPAPSPAPSLADTRAPESREATTALGGFVVRIAPAPDPVPLNEFFTVGVRVADAATPLQTRTDVAVDVDATMPAHGHGMNTKAMVERTGDTHIARGLLFHMPGEWQIWVDVGPGRERARFTVWVR